METIIKDSILTICEDVAKPDQIKVLKAGERLIESGSLSDKVYIIREGLFKLCVGYAELSLTIDFLLPGYVTGLVNLYQPTEYPCSITSITRSVVYEWDRKKILELMSLMPDVSKEIRRSYSGWGTRVVDRIKSLVFYSPKQRVISWILDYHSNPIYHQNKVWQSLSVEEMAAFCNVSVQEFEQELLRFSDLGLIKTDRQMGCIVVDSKSLSEMLSS